MNVGLNGTDVSAQMGEVSKVPLIATAIGPLPEAVMEMKIFEVESDPSCWVVVREGRYKGSDPALLAQIAAVPPLQGVEPGVIRRDVWVTIKYGQEMTGEQNIGV